MHTILTRVVSRLPLVYAQYMHVALVMNSASGVKSRRADLIRYLLSLGHRVTVVCAPDAELTSLHRMGVAFVSWSVSRSGMNPVLEFLSIIRLRTILSQLRPSIILCFTQKAVLYGSIAARFIHNCSVFSVFAGLGFLFGQESPLVRAISPVIHTIFRVVLKNNPLVFFQNPDDQNHFISKSILPHDRTCRIYGSGVDTNRFTPTTRSHSHFGTSFLMIARLIIPKGVLDYIQAASILKQEGHPTRALLLGPFDDHPTAVDPDLIRTSQDAGVIEYLGTTKDVRPYLDEADVFVLPSYYREGTPRSTLEAMAMAKPIITTDSPGCRETVLHDRNGYLVPVRNPRRLADAMRNLVGNQKRIREMGQCSRELAIDRYDVDKVNRQLWKEILQANGE